MAIGAGSVREAGFAPLITSVGEDVVILLRGEKKKYMYEVDDSIYFFLNIL